MRVGILTVELFLGEAGSLKDKRRHLKSLLTRLRNRYNVSVAEVDHQGNWQRATLAVAVVSNRTAHVDESLREVVNFIAAQTALEIIGHRTEVL
ncbi:DUF503 domain-containing protein [Candidatus Desulforudis audaxviator]|uniref:YlxP-like protein n=1 Tax=Desulforudis audaxviator (strain MP104C) TaxID=477974 RepID=B1I345_DESAP|nr:DUF503 domain-containing protein [Candidatus Desulforudis audaxviator]ACA59400.1 protein of unknown function DUF503 [Candidatus Desulforudis audaxviator MP104C]AZK59380.1 protein of unknown function DUF503 [Candidatus Desulforudis audaxviator]